MDVATILPNIGATLTLALGVMGLLRPAWAAAFTSIAPVGLLGVSEIRATYGGFFLALGAYALFVQQPVVWTMLGAAWIGAAAGRTYSAIVDRNGRGRNLMGIAFEAAIGCALLAG